MDTSFSAVARPDARILILGSMPGRASLQAQQYYAHPRNAFWPIIEHLFGIPQSQPYEQRLSGLTSRKIALWDVVHRCHRPGSLDQHIDNESVVANDFGALFSKCPDIHDVFFNGRKAQALFKRHVSTSLAGGTADLRFHLLPSTSPAHAAKTLAEKKRAWQTVKDCLVPA